ncbi:hypothetical protein HPB50_017227 [Hyalomma asiaticum]|uniref:Uncharacterized protein n=1 Tax=Hyalomma asiaticum TaxID=266040 RepID=A0ACB7TQM0_HYAAI|nr:hypothetical protein HPB50_017227 [Hyalomma asiaticum]
MVRVKSSALEYTPYATAGNAGLTTYVPHACLGVGCHESKNVCSKMLIHTLCALTQLSERAFDKDRFAGRRNGEDSEEITSVEATWQHLQSSRKHSPRNRGPGSNGSKSTATTRATTGQHDDQTKVTPRRRGRQPRANTPKL